MAEREGFEPSIGVTYTRFPSVLHRPLGHLSICSTFGPQKSGGDPSSRSYAPESAATVAPFQAWRSSLRIVARGPDGPP